MTAMPPDQLLRMVSFRGCRRVYATRHHVLVANGHRRSVIPQFTDDIPSSLVAKIATDLDVDLGRHPRSR